MKYLPYGKCEINGFALGEIESYAFGEIKSTHRRSDFTAHQRNFTRHRRISPTRRVDFIEKTTSEEVVFLARPKGKIFDFSRISTTVVEERGNSHQTHGLKSLPLAAFLRLWRRPFESLAPKKTS